MKNNLTLKFALIAFFLGSCVLAFERGQWASDIYKIRSIKQQNIEQKFEQTFAYGLTFAEQPQVFAYFEEISWENENYQQEEVNYDLSIDKNTINTTHFTVTVNLKKGCKGFHATIRWVAYNDKLLYSGVVNYPSYDKFTFVSDRGQPKYAVTFLQAAYYQGQADTIKTFAKNITSEYIQVGFTVPSNVVLKTAKALVLMWYDELNCYGIEYESKTFKSTEKQQQLATIQYPIYNADDLKFNPTLIFSGLRGYDSKITKVDASIKNQPHSVSYETNNVTVNTLVGSNRQTINQVFWTQIVCQEFGAKIDFDLSTTIDPFVNEIFLTGFIGGALILIAIFAVIAKPPESEIRQKQNNDNNHPHHDHDHDHAHDHEQHPLNQDETIKRGNKQQAH